MCCFEDILRLKQSDYSRVEFKDDFRYDVELKSSTNAIVLSIDFYVKTFDTSPFGSTRIEIDKASPSKFRMISSSPMFFTVYAHWGDIIVCPEIKKVLLSCDMTQLKTYSLDLPCWVQGLFGDDWEALRFTDYDRLKASYSKSMCEAACALYPLLPTPNVLAQALKPYWFTAKKNLYNI